MFPFTSSPAAKQFPTSPYFLDLVMRVGFAGKREVASSEFETVRDHRLNVFCTISWCQVGIAPMDNAVHERPVPAIAKFSLHRFPTFCPIHDLLEGADIFAIELPNSTIQNRESFPPYWIK